MSEPEYEKKTLNSIDDYKQTVFALIAFSNESRWDSNKNQIIPDSKFSFGRRMQTSRNNRISPDTEVTPDLVVQRRKDYGLIAEARKEFPQDQKLWSREIQQLEKYDDDLQGWYTENGFINLCDIILLTHLSRGVSVADFIKERRDKGKFQFHKKFALLAFSMVEERELSVSLEKKYGELSDNELSERLRKVVLVPVETLVKEYGKKKFYDAKPPTPYLLQILWDNIFSSLKDQFNYDGEKRYTPIQIDLEELTKILQQYYGFIPREPHDQEMPKRKWVKEALEILVCAKWAEKNQDKYIIKYKRKRGDTLRKFISLSYKTQRKIEKRKRRAAQLNFPFDQGD